MKKSLFTDTMIRKLKPAESDYTRSEGNGFTIRVMPSGAKTWLFLYVFDGKRRKMNLGSYPDVTLETARIRFEDARRMVRNGLDPMAEKEQAAEAQRKEPTVADLVNEFMVKWVAKKKTARSAYNDERSLKKDVLPRWGQRKANSIRRRDAILLLEEVAERAPGQAQYLAKCCRKMFSFGIQREIVEINPFAEMVSTIPELAPSKRGRTLSVDEIKTTWTAIDAGPGSDTAKRVLKMILATGQRPGEVCGMRRSEINESWWTIPPERMKNRKAHRVFLTQLALSLVPETDDNIVFPSARVTKQTPTSEPKPVTVGSLTFILKRAGYYGLPHFVAHDLRRTCRTFLAEIGIPREHAEAVLSHTLQGVEGTYNRHHYDREKQQALEAWSRKLISIITGTESKVIDIKSTRKKAA